MLVVGRGLCALRHVVYEGVLGRTRADYGLLRCTRAHYGALWQARAHQIICYLRVLHGKFGNRRIGVIEGGGVCSLHPMSVLQSV